MNELIESLSAAQSGNAVTEEALEGEWELVFSEVELFRSSPFFLAIEEALNGSPNIPALGRWLGLTDPTKKAELFFKLHQLRCSRGESAQGRIAHPTSRSRRWSRASTRPHVIPIIGWFKFAHLAGAW